MTNGEKFKKTFKISQVDDCDLNVYAWLPIHDAIEIPLEWWNAEYKGPTAKNDLGVDAVSRQAVLDIAKASKSNWIDNSILFKRVNELPPVTPQEPRCKECKWWKDSDGEYRRGCGAESQCPINTHAVYCGEGYCYMFEPQESEE